MTGEYVFDTEAIVAVLYDEPGSEQVRTFLDEATGEDGAGYLAEANASEVFYLVARFEGNGDEPTAATLRTADRDLRALERSGLAIERSDWRLAGEITAYGGLSLADACAVALAVDRDATLIAGGDDDFDSLPVDVSVRRFREHGV